MNVWSKIETPQPEASGRGTCKLDQGLLTHITKGHSLISPWAAHSYHWGPLTHITEGHSYHQGPLTHIIEGPSYHWGPLTHITEGQPLISQRATHITEGHSLISGQYFVYYTPVLCYDFISFSCMEINKP